jgi:hypothetical protein
VPSSGGRSDSAWVRDGNEGRRIASTAGGPGNITTALVRAARDASAACDGRRVCVSGQSTVEYVMAAGMLVATGLVISGILTSGARDFLRSVVREASFLSP